MMIPQPDPVYEQVIKVAETILSEWEMSLAGFESTGLPPPFGDVNLDTIVLRELAQDHAPELRQSVHSLWSYMDAFLGSADHGFATMDGIPWPEAAKVLRDSVDLLRKRESITDQRVMRYPWIYGKG
jgi:hypothetical protein